MYTQESRSIFLFLNHDNITTNVDPGNSERTVVNSELRKLENLHYWRIEIKAHARDSYMIARIFTSRCG